MSDLILEYFFFLPKTAVLVVQCEVSCCHAGRTISSLSTDSVNQMRQYFSIIFLIHSVTWWNTFFVNDSVTIKKCET
jgi:hypothetical protein